MTESVGAAAGAAAPDVGRLRAAKGAHVVGPHEVCAGGGEQFSGFLPAGGGARYFFWLARSRSAAPKDDPLVIWLTGGPGCSSSLALLAENGPCRVGAGARGRDTQPNAWSWTEAANVVWLDQPAGVGFSEGPAVASEKGVDDHMYEFLQSFYNHFPEYLQVPLFLLGESYAGHYLPTIATRILKEPRAGGLPIQLRGVGIGNGLVNPWPQLASQPPMAFTGGQGGSLGHGVVGLPTFEAMEAVLPPCHTQILACQRAPQDAETCMTAFQACVLPQLYPIMLTRRNLYDMRWNCTAGYPLCYNFDRETEFLRSPEVQRALGVHPARGWESCNTSIALAFVRSGDWLQRFDRHVAELLGAGVRVLVYNGDTDYMVDWVGSKRWAGELEWPHRAAWAATRDVPFLVGGSARGAERSKAGLTFLQLYDAGHMVPRDQPQASLAMLREFLSEPSRWAAGNGTATVAAASLAAAEAPAALPDSGPFAPEGVFAALLALTAPLLALLAHWARRSEARACRYPPLLAA